MTERDVRAALPPSASGAVELDYAFEVAPFEAERARDGQWNDRSQLLRIVDEDVSAVVVRNRCRDAQRNKPS